MMATPQLKKVQSSHQSLLSGSAMKKQTKIKVFFQEPTKIHKIEIDAQNMTTQAVISAAVQAFNQKFNLCLVSNPGQYELFAARKDGVRDDGLPALDGNHYIVKTMIKRFYLSPLLKLESICNPVETKDTFSSIKSQFNVNSTCGKQILDIDHESNKGFSFCHLFCLKR